MANDGYGFNDSVTMGAPGYAESLEQAQLDWLAKITPCPTCNTMRVPVGAWPSYFVKPTIYCPNSECKPQITRAW